MDMLHRLDTRVTQITKGIVLLNLFLWYGG